MVKEYCLHGIGDECGPCSLAEVKNESEDPRWGALTRSSMQGFVFGGFTMLQPSTRDLAVIFHFLLLSQAEANKDVMKISGLLLSFVAYMHCKWTTSHCRLPDNDFSM
jgi:hypothetical protein